MWALPLMCRHAPGQRGSSPRLRGTGQHIRVGRRHRRFIPAPAGNRQITACQNVCLTVHPRACGEQGRCPSIPRSRSGSSPRLRGTDGQAARPAHVHRFIPAPAGNSWPRTGASALRAVHPRACGEQRAFPRLYEVPYGSSPRLRGTALQEDAAGLQYRFIPAPAGNREPHHAPGLLSTVHPRACGEQTSYSLASSSRSGSSPRLRGTGVPSCGVHRSFRFIPAPAGNSRPGLMTRIPPTVHPRACGEQLCRRSPWTPASGSSPRLRGTEYLYLEGCRVRRFIPAPAGNSSIS